MTIYDDLLIATDPTDEAHEATKHGIELAKRLDATVHVLSVYPDAPEGTQQRDHLRTDAQAEAKTAVERVVEAASSEQIEASGEIVSGVPYERILDAANDRSIDMIVMGTHGRDGIDHLLSGSVAEEVIRNAEVPVVTVRTSS